MNIFYTVHVIGCILAIVAIYLDEKYMWVDGQKSYYTRMDVIKMSFLSWVLIVVFAIVSIMHHWEHGLLRRIKNFFDTPFVNDNDETDDE